MNSKIMASCRGLNCGYFGTKSKVIGQVEEELGFILPLRLTDGIFYFFLFNKFDVKYLEE